MSPNPQGTVASPSTQPRSARHGFTLRAYDQTVRHGLARPRLPVAHGSWPTTQARRVSPWVPPELLDACDRLRHDVA